MELVEGLEGWDPGSEERQELGRSPTQRRSGTDALLWLLLAGEDRGCWVEVA